MSREKDHRTDRDDTMDPDERAPTRAPAATGQAQSQDSEQQSAESLAEMQQKLLRAFVEEWPAGKAYNPRRHMHV